MSIYTVLITGASRGIGLGLAREFLEHSNFRVIATCRNPLEAEALQSMATNTRKASGEARLVVMPLEVNSIESHENVKAQLASKGINSIDILIGNAGVLSSGPATTCPATAVKHDFETNLIGSMLTLQCYAELVLKSELKIFSVMSSILGSIANAETSGGIVPYRVSKAALNMFAVSFAAEPKIRDAGCKMLILHPGWVQTDMGGEGASITIEESATGLYNVFHDAMMIQKKSEDLVAVNYENFHKKLMCCSCAYVSYQGEVLPW